MPSTCLSSPAFKPKASSHQAEQVKSSYQPHLDGLRALAILGVLFEHFGVALPSLLRCGPLSVRFFFVLSGYFVTLSLWKMQAEILDSKKGSLAPLGRFYFSRFLRIGPPFYLALSVGALCGIIEVQNNLFWLATFQTNNYIAYLGYWPDSISHFWSLAVQEQFYLIWPLVILALPRRWFLSTMMAFIVFGLGFRLFCIATDASTLIRWVTLLGCFDSFAVGALIAYLRQTRLLEQIRFWPKPLIFAMPLMAFACFFIGRALMTLPEGNYFLALTETVDAVFLAWALSTVLLGVKGRYARFLGWPPLVYLGRISYGIYVYHVFVIILLSPLLVPFGLTEDHYSFARIALMFMVTVALAALSWRYLEQPFLAWKKELAPVRRQKAVPETPQPEISFA